MAWYRTGTVNVTTGSATVAGIGTSWISGASVGEGFYGPDGKIYEISAIVSATQLTLATPYLGSTQSTATYVIVPSQSYLRDLALQAATLVNDYASVVSGVGLGKFDDGTLASPGIRFTADENTGMRRVGADNLALVTGGSDRLTVSSSTVTFAANPTLSAGAANGVLFLNGSKAATSGSALTFDGTAFQIGANMVAYGSLNVARNTLAPYATITTGDQATPANTVGLYLRQTSGAAGISTAGSDLAFFNGGPGVSELMRLTSTGLGIGTSSPSRKLDVQGAPVGVGGDGTGVLANFVNNTTAFNASPTAAISLWNRINTAGSTFPSAVVQAGKENATDGNYAGYLSLQTTNAAGVSLERARLDSSGNLGIGTSSPAAKVHANAPGGVAFVASDVAFTASQVNIGVGVLTAGRPFIGTNTSSNPLEIGTRAAIETVFVTGGTERMRLDTSGNLGIGAASPGARLDVSAGVNALVQQWQGAGTQFTLRLKSGNGALQNTPVYRLYMDYNNEANTNGYIDFYRGGDGATGFLTFGTSGTEKMRLDASGNLGVGTGAPNQRLEVRGTIRAGLMSSSVNGTVLLDDSYSGTDALTSISVVRSSGGLLLGQGVMQKENAEGLASTQGAANLAKGALLLDVGRLMFSNVSAAAVARGDTITLTERFRIDQNGNVGIGAAPPKSALNIERSSSANTVADSASIVLSNRNSDSGTFLAGGIFSNTHRDVTTSQYTAGIWFEKQNSSNAGVLASQGAVVLGADNYGADIGARPTERMRITAEGNLGVGTGVPAGRIHAFTTLNGDQYYFDSASTSGYTTMAFRSTASSGTNIPVFAIRQARTSFAGAAQAGELRFDGLTTSGSYTEFASIYASSTGANSATGAATALIFNTSPGTSSAVERMRLDASGNLGIGTSSPGYRLSLGPTLGRKVAIYESGGVASGLGTDVFGGAYEVSFWSGTPAGGQGMFTWGQVNTTTNAVVERMRLDASGNLGIGATTSSGTVTVQTAAGPSLALRRDLQIPGENTLGFISFLGRYDASSYGIGASISAIGHGTAWSSTSTPAYLAFNTTPVGSTTSVERMRINSSGNLGIGVSPSYRLHVKGSGSTNATYALVANNSSDTNIFAARDDGYFTIPFAYNNTTASAANAFIDGNGGLIRSTSSLRYKKDVADATHGLAEVLQLRPVVYKGKSSFDGNKVFGGLIAEEVHALGLTEFVDYDADGQPDALHYGHMVSLLAKAIQELKADLDAAKARITVLEAA